MHRRNKEVLKVKSLEDLPDIITIHELAELLRIGINKAYELSEIKGFPVIKLGRRKVVSKAGLKKWLTSQEDKSVQLKAI